MTFHNSNVNIIVIVIKEMDKYNNKNDISYLKI